MIDPNVSDGRRAGATWVAATGAFLLVAAAAVFIAVRSGTGWRGLLLAEGVVGVAAIGALAVGTGSPVLAAAATLGTVVLALGIAAVTALPAPLVLAGAAVAAAVAGRRGRRPAIAWAAVAGLAPVLAVGAARALAFAAGRRLGAGTLEELGLVGHGAALVAVLSSGLAAGVLGREAHRAKDLALVALAGLSLASGAATSWVASEPTITSWMLALPSLFVAFEVVAMVSERDDFWRRPARAAGLAAEVAALLAAPVAAGTILLSPIAEDGLDLFADGPGWAPQPTMAVAWALVATGWFLASWRRRSPQPTLARAVVGAAADDRTVAFLTVALAAAVVVGTASTVATAVTLLGLAGALFASRRILAAVVAAPLAAWAPVVVAVAHPAAVLPVGAAAPPRRVALGPPPRGGVPPRQLNTQAGDVVGGTGAQVAHLHESPALGLLVLVFGGWVLAAAVEGVDEAAATLARFPMVLAPLAAMAVPDRQALPVVLTAAFLLAVDAIRTDDPRIAVASAVVLPLAVLPAAGLAGLRLADAGLVLAMAAVVAGGLAVLTPARWRTAVLTAGGWSLALGLGLATSDPVRFAEVLLVTGGLGIAAGVALRSWWLGHGGGVLAALALGLLLSDAGVTAVEPYLAPIALQLAVLGARLRGDERASSWVAYGPAMGLLAVPALAARWDGGPAWHALVAGAVGVVGVAAGGWRRLAGPLLLGTGLLVLVTFVESLHTLAGVPTWAWLATGGSVLLVTGVALERSATSPAEAGRRLVDVVSERFE
jgi:hypothetical protein